MPILKTPIEADRKAQFRQLAKSKKLTEASLLRQLVDVALDGGAVINHEPATMVVAVEGNTSKRRATVRLAGFLMEAAEGRAALRGMPVSTWIAALVQSNLMQSPVMTDAEIIELRAANRAMVAIGRNINQIARSLNETFHATERVRLDALATVTRVLERHERVVLKLVRASQNDWKAD